uniref:Myotubularin phosphatase domain-containing protein n=1 Tax=Rhabditophanes sp. KR3021 TaxID=114890 RepID=A0AC35UBZ7_9BILA
MQFNSFEIVKFPRVYMIDRFRSDSNLIGCIHITSRHVIFKADHVRKELWLMNKLIASAEKVGSTSYGSKILIRCKNYLSIILIVKENEAVDFLQKIANVSTKTFRTFIENKKMEIQKDIWEGEFRRQKLPAKWEKSWLNEQYEYCETYPRELWFPASVSKATIIGSSKFRTGGRLPVLTYYHHKSDATISRCSQPLSGFSGRCIEDEELIKHILDANSNNTQIYLIDTRPVMNTIINMMQGIGYEDIKNYANLKRHSFEIEGYSVIRDSLGELLEACNYTNNSHTCYLTMIEKCRWLKHLRAIVECSKFIAESVSSQISCVVLSTDENIQLFSIAQMILDPHYRTIKGFQILIEKDWLGFSHQFEDIAPVFTQFLDNIYSKMTLGRKPPQQRIPFVTPMERVSKLKAEAKEHWKRKCIDCGEILDTALRFQEHMVVHELVNVCYVMACEEVVTNCEIPKLENQSGSRNDIKNGAQTSDDKSELSSPASNHQAGNYSNTYGEPETKRRKAHGQF